MAKFREGGMVVLLSTLLVCEISCYTYHFNYMRGSGISTANMNYRFQPNFLVHGQGDKFNVYAAIGPNDGQKEACLLNFNIRDRNDITSDNVIAGNCGRGLGPNKYNDGLAGNAHTMYPMHGYATHDGEHVLFVDMHSCARKLKLSNKLVTTVIGKHRCGNGTLTMDSFGQDTRVFGMTYIDQKNMWVFCLSNGIYIYNKNGAFGKKLMEPTVMGKFHTMWDGMLTRNHYSYKIYHKVPYGVNEYDLSDVTATQGQQMLTWSANSNKVKRIFSLKSHDSDETATYKWLASQPDLELGSGNGHVAVHPYYQGVLLVSDYETDSVYFFIVSAGYGLRFCTVNRMMFEIQQLPMTGVNSALCGFPDLRSAIWIPEESLGALVVDRSIMELMEIGIRFGPDGCDSLPCHGGKCYDVMDSFVCICHTEYMGERCQNLICPENRCNGHGTCSAVQGNYHCECDPGWRGRTCLTNANTIMNFRNTIAKGNAYKYSQPHVNTNDVKFSPNFLLLSSHERSTIYAGFYHPSSGKEGCLGKFRIGDNPTFTTGFAGSCVRSGSPLKFNDHVTGGLAHMVKPMHGYETKDGKYLLFVDSQSCARRRSLTGTGGVETIIGIGRCGNGTLDLGSLGTATKVTGMTYLDEQQMWIFSGSFGIYSYAKSGGSRKKRLDRLFSGKYYENDVPLGFMARGSGLLVYGIVPYGINKYDFTGLNHHNHNTLSEGDRLTKLFSLKQTLWDKDAVYQYDPKYSTIVLGASGHIATNPTYPELLLVSDHASDSLFTFNVTDGNGMKFCKKSKTAHATTGSNVATCSFKDLKNAAWISTTGAVVNDQHFPDLREIRFKLGGWNCNNGNNKCNNRGHCYDLHDGYECLCNRRFYGDVCQSGY